MEHASPLAPLSLPSPERIIDAVSPRPQVPLAPHALASSRQRRRVTSSTVTSSAAVETSVFARESVTSGWGSPAATSPGVVATPPGAEESLAAPGPPDDQACRPPAKGASEGALEAPTPTPTLQPPRACRTGLTPVPAPTPTLGIPSLPWYTHDLPPDPSEALLSLTRKYMPLLAGGPSASQFSYCLLRTAFFALPAMAVGRMVPSGRLASDVADGGASDFNGLGLMRQIAGVLELHRRDIQNVQLGYYRPPLDMDPRHRQFDPLFVSRQMVSLLGFAADFVGRSRRRGGLEAWDTATRGKAVELAGRYGPPVSYPEYYLQNFHYQRGWLTEFGTSTYEIGTEMFFLGAQDATQRASLVPLHFFMRGRDEASTRLLEVGAGNGRFMTFVKDNYPRIQATVSDLSPAFLELAEQNMHYLMQFDRRVNRRRAISAPRFVQAKAEQLPFDDASVDVLTCTNLIHELPPLVRHTVAKEFGRVVASGGIIIINDSFQREDMPGFDFDLFPDNVYEPYYKSYLDEDLVALFAAEGFTQEAKFPYPPSKVVCMRKPLTV